VFGLSPTSCATISTPLEPEETTQTSAILRTGFRLDDPGLSVEVFWAYEGEDCGEDENAWLNTAQGRGNATATFDDGVWSALANNLKAGSNYVYRFKAVDSTGEIHWSDPETFFTMTDLPNVFMRSVDPGLITATVDVELTWLGSSGAVGILLLAGTNNCEDVAADWIFDNPSFAPIITNDCTLGQHTLTIAGLTNNTTYFCRAFAFTATETNAAPSSLSFTTPNHSTWIDNGPGTDWKTLGNWDNGVPFDGVTANFYHPGATVTASSGLTVGTALVNANGTVVFDLDGETLSVTDGMVLGGTPLPGYPAAVGGTSMVLTNGVIDATGRDFTIGHGDATFPAYLGQDNSLVIQSGGSVIANNVIVGRPASTAAGLGSRNHLSVLGPDAHVAANFLYVGSGWANSTGNTLLMRDLDTTLGRLFISNNGSSNTGRVEHSRVAFTGAGISFNGAGNTLVVSDSEMNFGPNGYLSFEQSVNSALISSNSVWTSSSHLYGTLGSGRAFHFYGTPASANPGGVYSSRMTFFNTSLAGTQSFYTFENTHVRATNFLHFYATGARLAFTNCLVEVANNFTLGNTDDTGLRCEFFGASTNALLTAQNIVFHGAADDVVFTLNGGRLAPRLELNIASRADATAGNTFAITGPSSLVETPTFRASSNACVRFEIPADGYDVAPIQPGNAYFDPETKIVITTKNFSGRQRLVEAQAGGGLFFDDGVNAPVPFGNDSFTIPNSAYPQFEADIPRNFVATVILTPASMEVKIYPTPTLFMVR